MRRRVSIPLITHEDILRAENIQPTHVVKQRGGPRMYVCDDKTIVIHNHTFNMMYGTLLYRSYELRTTEGTQIKMIPCGSQFNPGGD